MEWQPIETAPKSGLIWAYNGQQACMEWIEGEGFWAWYDENLREIDPDPEQPTHWMPMPEAP